MEKNIIEKFGEKIRIKSNREKSATNKYWKLSATERIHYDSCRDRIDEESMNFLFITRLTVKLSIVIPLFLIFVGAMIGNLEIMIESAQNVFISLMRFLTIALLGDLAIATVTAYSMSNKIKKLDKRFKLTK